MCVLFIAWRSHPRHRLVVAANRDEFRARPTAALARWDTHPDVVGGRDLQAGGTWLAASTRGRFAAVTNFRQAPLTPGRSSRGALVNDFVCGSATPAGFVQQLSAAPDAYGGANLFVADASSLWHWSNRGEAAHSLPAGLYALSNGRLGDDWPKMRRGREALGKLVSSVDIDEAALFALLGDRTPSSDDELPDTGVGLPRERALSPIFIAGDDYGTRASTVLLVGHDGSMRVHEKRWGAAGVFEGESRVELPGV